MCRVETERKRAIFFCVRGREGKNPLESSLARVCSWYSVNTKKNGVKCGRSPTSKSFVIIVDGVFVSQKLCDKYCILPKHPLLDGMSRCNKKKGRLG